MSQPDDPISREHLQAIGSITVNFASLETWLGMITWKLISNDQLLGQTITAELSFRKLVDLLSAIFLHRTADEDQKSELQGLLQRALQVEEKRNIIVHSRWGSGDSRQTITRLKTTARKFKGLRHQFEQMSVSDLNVIADEIEQLTFDLRAFYWKQFPE